MEITKIAEGSVLTLLPKGRLDTVTAPALDGVLKASLEGVTALILDLAELEYISSAGLRILLNAQRAMKKQGKMTVRHVCPDVMEVFEITGFTDVLTIE